MNRSPLRWPTSGISHEILISDVKFLERLLKLQGYIALWQKSINQALVAISEFIIVWAASCISNELRNVHTIRRTRWYVAGKEWKIDNVIVKFITFIIQRGWKLSFTVYATLAAEKSALFLLPLYLLSAIFNKIKQFIVWQILLISLGWPFGSDKIVVVMASKWNLRGPQDQLNELRKFTSCRITRDLRISNRCLATLLLSCHLENVGTNPITDIKASSYGLLHPNSFKSGWWILILYKCKVSFRIFDLTWLNSCKRVIGLVWNIKSFLLNSFCTRKLNHKVEFLGCILYLKMPDFRSSKGPCPLDPHQTSTLDLLGEV